MIFVVVVLRDQRRGAGEQRASGLHIERDADHRVTAAWNEDSKIRHIKKTNDLKLGTSNI